MDRKTDSKSNLNESILPLLDDEKEKIELTAKSATETTASADDKASDAEKKAAEDAVDAAKKKKEEEKERKRLLKLEEEEKKKKEKLEKQKKKDEEKELKKKQKEEKKAAQDAAKANGSANASGSSDKNWNACSMMTVGVDLAARDRHAINEHVNIDFEDVIGEPEGNHGIDGPYTVSFQTFELVKFWIYRILMTLISIPLAAMWGVIFALLSLVSVWLLTPAFRVFDILLFFVHRLWSASVRTVLDPIFLSISLIRADRSKPMHQTPTPTCSGRVVFRSKGYNQLSTSETVATYTKTDNEESQVALSIEKK